MSVIDFSGKRITDIINYLDARDEDLRQEDVDLENRYDTMPQWGWKRKDAMLNERQKINGFITFLRTLQHGL